MKKLLDNMLILQQYLNSNILYPHPKNKIDMDTNTKIKNYEDMIEVRK